MTAMVKIPDHALDTLTGADARLGKLIARVGEFRLQRQSGASHFQLLARAIIYQQLAGRAARSIFVRATALGPRGRFPRAPELLQLTAAQLREAGLSRQKIAALYDLATHVVDGRLPLARLARLDDEAIISRLCNVRGIGRWTAEMFLMFRLARLDVLPTTDLGVRKGLAALDGLAQLPTPRQLYARGERWRPFRSVASWYLWRVLDDQNGGDW